MHAPPDYKIQRAPSGPRSKKGNLKAKTGIYGIREFKSKTGIYGIREFKSKTGILGEREFNSR